MIAAAPGYLTMGWLQSKLPLVVLLLVYHVLVLQVHARLRARPQHARLASGTAASTRCRRCCCIGIVILAVVKPF